MLITHVDEAAAHIGGVAATVGASITIGIAIGATAWFDKWSTKDTVVLFAVLLVLAMGVFGIFV